MLFTLTFSISIVSLWAQNPSVARQWNEILLHSIRGDFARPTVHARNLFHISAAMYDCFAALDETADSYFLIGNTVNSYRSNFIGFEADESIHLKKL